MRTILSIDTAPVLDREAESRRPRCWRVSAGASVAFGLLMVGCWAGLGWGRAPIGASLYNEGTRQLADGRLREAEATLQQAIVLDDERVLPRALYNLGQVRFRAGARALADVPPLASLQTQAGAAGTRVVEAVRFADAALAGTAATPLVAARSRLLGARRLLRAAIDSTRRVAAAHDAIAERWRRAGADFRGVVELRPSHGDASFNAEAVDRHLAALAEPQSAVRDLQDRLERDRRDVEARLAALRERLPRDHPQNAQGDDDEEQDESSARRPDATPSQEQGGQEQELALSPEEALRLLGSLKLEANRQLPLSEPRSAQPGERAGRNW